MENTLLLMDTFYFLHRSFHAYPLDLKNSKGLHTNIIYGFTLSLLDSMLELSPTHIACGWESEELPSFRKELYPLYQATRISLEPDEEMIFGEQLPYVIKMINAFNIPRYTQNGFEGDDVLGTIASKASNEAKVIISTTDQDLTQLINDRISIFKPARGRFIQKEVIDKDVFKEKYKFESSQMIDFKALKGDPSDNIPGVKGIGEKTAADLLQKYKSLEEIYNHLNDLQGSVKEKLLNGKENAFLSKQLATIITDIPMDFNIRECLIHDYDVNKISRLFDELEFRSLNKKLEKVEKIMAIKRGLDTSNKESDQYKLF